MELLPIFLLFYVFLVLLIALHEFGHAVAAKLMGFKVFWVSIGKGRNIFDTKIFGVPVFFNAIPLSGETLFAPRVLKEVKLRFWIITFAGPFTHILWITIFFLYSKALNINPLTESAPHALFIYANGLLLITNLFPFKYKRQDVDVYSDGYQLLTLPFKNIAESPEYKLLANCTQIHDALEKEKYDEVIEKCNLLLKEKPCSDIENILGIAKLGKGEIKESHEIFSNLLNKIRGKNPNLEYYVLNNMAWCAAILNKKDLLMKSDEITEMAATKTRGYPINKYINGTRGSVLIRLGRNDEGLSLLYDSYRKHTEENAKAALACFISLGEAIKGNSNQARKMLDTAKGLKPDYYLIDMLEKEILPLI